LSVVVIDTSTIEDPLQVLPYPKDWTQWIYNGFDTAVTLEVWQKQQPLLDDVSATTEEFSWRMIPMAMRMTMRGIKIDLGLRDKMVLEAASELSSLESYWDDLCDAVCGEKINTRSPPQLRKLFYTHLGIRPIPTRVKGETKYSMDIKTLEKIQIYFHAKPLAKCILAIRDLKGFIETMETGIDADGRIRATLNVVGTETGRWSSTKNACGRGNNIQNWTEALRKLFISDHGYRFGNIDLEQAESRGIAYLAGDAGYIDACESSDLHTTVARMLWPEFPWSGDPDEARAQAEEPGFYRHFSRRDITKRLGHGTNYWGSAWEMARSLGLEQTIVEDFQARYFSIFSGVSRYHHEISEQLRAKGYIQTPLGRRRHFFSRLWDDSTVKEAIAHSAQSLIVDYLNTVMVALFEEYDFPDKGIQILNHGHDALIYQYEENKPDLPEKIKSKFDSMYVDVRGRRMHIPVESTVGYNWGKRKPDNPSGLCKYGSEEARTQTRPKPTSILDARL